jgi:hypothetical protein
VSRLWTRWHPAQRLAGHERASAEQPQEADPNEGGRARESDDTEEVEILEEQHPADRVRIGCVDPGKDEAE